MIGADGRVGRRVRGRVGLLPLSEQGLMEVQLSSGRRGDLERSVR